MAKQLEFMTVREQRIGELVEYIRRKSGGFRRPPLIVIGGYALRAYVPSPDTPATATSHCLSGIGASTH